MEKKATEAMWFQPLNKRIYLIIEWCCAAPLAVVPGRAAPKGVEIDAVVVIKNLLDS